MPEWFFLGGETGFMDQGAPLLEIKDLRVSFAIQGGKVEAVRGVNLNVPQGKVVALVGESGSGKSVIAQAILRILPKNADINAGSIILRDPLEPDREVDIARLDNKDPYLLKIRGGRISMVFQEPMTALSPIHTIGSQIEEALALHQKRTKTEARNDMYSFELSGGLRQRAVIAMALICNPAMVIADEPTTALDVTVQAQIIGLMKSLQEKFSTSILLITHDLGVVANMADHVVVIYHGRIMEAGSIDDIFRNPQHPYLKALMDAVPHFDMKPGQTLVSLREAAATSEDDAVKKLAHRFRAEQTGTQDGPHLSVKNLRKEFHVSKGSWFGLGENRTIVAVDDVSFDVARGECLGLVGESGSGKTTVSKLIMRAIEATQGSVVMNTADGSKEILKLDNNELKTLRRRVQMIFQDPFSSLNPRMTVMNILREPFAIHGIGSKDEQLQDIVDLMRLVGLDPRFLNRYPHSFSGGQRQRIGIARALSLHPEFLICDEPVSALDVSVQAQILNLLNDLRAELGLTSIFISHNLAVVNYVADRIAVMCQGKLVELAGREQLFANPRHPYTKSLLASVPYPDLDHLLDFENMKFVSSFAADDWGAAFQVSKAAGLRRVEVEEGHFVLANENSDIRELSA